MLIFQINPRSFIRAAVLHLRDGLDIAPEQGVDLLGGWGSTTEDPDIIQRYQEIMAEEPWGIELENSQVQKLVFFNLRHSTQDWHLLSEGIRELLDKGPKHLLFGTGPAGHKLVSRRNQVVREIHRLAGFTRLVPAPDGTMVGKAPVKHHTGDLLALALARRNPDQPLALLTPTGAWFTWKGRVTPLEDRDRQLPDDGFGKVWLTYYRSQFIQERNNPRHAARAIPQEYWQWLDEGKELLDAKNRKSKVGEG